jgi:hypothetical protein
MLFEAVIPVYCEDYRKHADTLFGENEEFLN